MRTITITAPGPQGIQGAAGLQGDSIFSNKGSGVFATTSSIQVTGSFTVSGSSTFTNIGPAVFSGSVTINGATAVTTATLSSLTASSAGTASYLNNLNQDLTFNGNLTLNGTASIAYLNVQYESASIIYSSGSNQLGDAANDTQTLYGGVVIPTGSLTVSGSVSFGTSSAGFFWNNTNSRLGIGTSSPASPLHVVGEIRVNAGQAITLDTSNNIYAIGAGNQFRIYSGGTASLNIATNGNTLIGTTTDAGYKLNVRGEARISSSLTLDSQPIFRVENGFGANVVDVRGNGQLVLGGSSDLGLGTGLGVFTRYSLRVGALSYADASAILQADSTTRGFLPPRTATTASITSPAQGLITYLTGSTNEGLYYYNSGSQVGWHKMLTNTGSQSITGSLTVSGVTTFAQGSSVNGSGNLSIGAFSVHSSYGFATFSATTLLLTGGTFTSTTGNQVGLSFGGGFTPTSGTATYSAYSILPTINQTGGANGITRGLYVNPTLTAAADYRAIETTSGSVLFSHGASTLLFASSSGNVGIGTSTPTKRLEIHDSTSGDGLAIARGAVPAQRIELIPNDSTVSTLIKGGGNGKPFYIASWANGGTAQPLYFGTNYSNGIDQVRMTIDATGSVGIGTTTPAYALDVRTSSGFIVSAFKSQYSATGYIGTDNSAIWIGRGTDGFNSAFVAGSNLLLFRANNVQVGQFWSTGNFTIQTGGTYIDAGYKLDVKGSTRVQGAGTTSATTALRVENTNASASLVVLDNGFVGINTGSAAYNLDVNGTARVKGAGATSATSAFTVQNSAGTNGLNVQDDGKVTIGRTAGAYIEVGSLSNFHNTSAGYDHVFRSGGSQIVRIVAAGGIFIGSGSVNASSVLQADSTTQGFLPPRMTNVQRLAITSPAVGLMVYCTDVVEGLYINKSTGWTFIV